MDANLSNRLARLSAAQIKALSERLRRTAEGRSPRLVIPPRGETAPLSFAQERLWFIEQLGLAGPAYNIAVAYRLRGPLEGGVLEQSFADLQHRHEILRTRFVALDGQPRQIIDPPGRSPLHLVDLSRLGAAEREAELRALVEEDLRLLFDLERGPLLRVSLVILGAKEHVLRISTHHIIFDGWSMAVLMREVSELYAAHMEKRRPALQPLILQYADYALWQRQQLQAQTAQRERRYWKQQLAEAPPVLQLPADRPRPVLMSFRGGIVPFELPPPLHARLIELARGETATLYMVLLAAFQVLLWRLCGQRDIVVGSPIAGRTHHDLENMIGLFVNTLLLRARISCDSGFIQLLRQVKEYALGAFAHQELPFEKLVAELQPERDLSRNPLFQTIFAFQNSASTNFEFAGLSASPVFGEHRTAKFDFSLYVTEMPGRALCTFEYSADLFDRATIDRWVSHFRVLLEAVVSDPCQPLAGLPLLTAAERQRQLIDWNETTAQLPVDRCIHELVAAQAQRTPQAIAVVCLHERLTYQELEWLSNRLAHHLREQGVGPETIVGLCMERSIGLVVGLLGILKAGAAYLPLDPGYPAARLTSMLAAARVPVVLTQLEVEHLVCDAGARLVRLDAEWACIRNYPPYAPSVVIRPNNLAYVIYTSGSTGVPKGVMIQHKSVVSFLTSVAELLGINSSDMFAALTPLSFDISVLEIFLPLLTGARCDIVPRPTAMDGPKLRAWLEQHRPTVVQATPSSWQMLLDAAWEATCRHALCGGEELFPSLARTLAGLSGQAWNLYGPTEATVWALAARLEQGERVSIGRPLGNTKAYILDDKMNAVPVGVEGELYLGGVGLARGYLSGPEMTAERFVASPFCAGERLYRTGDWAHYIADGRVQFMGRRDLQVKIRGYRIEVAEIEAALLSLADVKQAVVQVYIHESGRKQLIAYVVRGQSHSVGAEELRQQLKMRLPEYMVPSVFRFLEALPLSPNGKVDRRSLSGLTVVEELISVDEAPRTPAEIAVAAVWVATLGSGQKVGLNDNFFALGGDSLLAVKLLASIRAATGIEIQLLELFSAPTVREMVQLIENHRPSMQARVGTGGREQLALEEDVAGGT